MAHDSTPPLRLRPHKAYKSLRVFPEGAPSCFLPWCETTTRSHLPSSLCPPALTRKIIYPLGSMRRPSRRSVMTEQLQRPCMSTRSDRSGLRIHIHLLSKQEHRFRLIGCGM